MSRDITLVGVAGFEPTAFFVPNFAPKYR
jgi:hypothetical protein